MKRLLLLAMLWSCLGGARVMAQPGLVPVSDPSRLTSEQLFREIAQLEKSMNQQLGGIIKTDDEFKASLARFPTDVDQKIATLTTLQAAILETQKTRSDERFSAVALQFKASAELAATQSASNAATLSEIKARFDQLIQKQQDTQSLSSRALEDKIATVKDSVTGIESRTRGQGDSWTVLGAAIAALGVLGGLFIAFNNRRAAPPRVEKV